MSFCGPEIKEKLPFHIKIVLYFLNFIIQKIRPIFFEASCEKHDDGYNKGISFEEVTKITQMTIEMAYLFKIEDLQKEIKKEIILYGEEKRIICDNKFFYYICRDIEIQECSVSKKVYYYILAGIFFYGVRICGKYFFNYNYNA